MESRYLLFARVLVALAVLLFVGFLPNSTYFILFKIVCIVGIALLAYKGQLLLPVPGDEHVSIPPDEEAESNPDAADGAPVSDKPQTVEEHFQSFLDTILPLIKETLVAKTVVLLMVNRQKEKFYVRQKVTEFERQFAADEFLPMDAGLTASLFKKKRPLLENRLPMTDNLLPYYVTPRPIARSFLGVPLQFERYLAGLLCVDSDVEEAFSEDDLKILERYSRLISVQLASSNRLYEYENENWITQALYEFSKAILNFSEVGKLYDYLALQMKTIFGADRVVVCERAGDKCGKIVYLSQGEHSVEIGDEFPDDGGLAGWVLRKNQSILVEDFSSKENYIPRFYLQEKPFREYLSLLAVPVLHGDNAFMVISLEARQKARFGPQHKKVLETLANLVAVFLLKKSSPVTLPQGKITTEDARVGGAEKLHAQLAEQIRQSDQEGGSFCLQMLRFGQSSDLSLATSKASGSGKFVSFVLPFLEESDYIFRADADTIVVLWSGRKANEVASIMEKMVKTLEQQSPRANERLEVYLNFGLVEYPLIRQNAAGLLKTAEKALLAAEEKGKNRGEICQPQLEEIKSQGE